MPPVSSAPNSSEASMTTGARKIMASAGVPARSLKVGICAPAAMIGAPPMMNRTIAA